MTAAGLLDELETTLLQLSVLLPADKAVWDANQLLRLAVERLWILAGTTAETYRTPRTSTSAPCRGLSCTSSATSWRT